MNNFNYFEAMFFNGVDDLKYIENCVTDHQEILGEIRRILVERNCISEEPFNSRVFINNGTRDDFGALVSNFPPEQNEHLDDWLKRITCEDSFCVVLNGINAWSDDISKKYTLNLHYLGFLDMEYPAKELMFMPLWGNIN